MTTPSTRPRSTVLVLAALISIGSTACNAITGIEDFSVGRAVDDDAGEDSRVSIGRDSEVSPDSGVATDSGASSDAGAEEEAIAIDSGVDSGSEVAVDSISTESSVDAGDVDAPICAKKPAGTACSLDRDCCAGSCGATGTCATVCVGSACVWE